MTDYAISVVVDGPIRTQVPLEPLGLVLSDVLPDLVFTVEDQDGNLANLTGASATFKIRKAGTSTTTNDANNVCTVTVLTSVIDYDLIATDFPRAGLYEGQLAITFAGGLQTVYKLVYMSVRSAF